MRTRFAGSPDWPALLAGHDGWTLVANLPYNVAAPLVADLLDGVPQIRRMLVMVQREVAERLAARAGDAAYGALSVKVAYWAEASVVGRVPATVFLPRPRVESALVGLERRSLPAVDPATVAPDRLFEVVRAAFGQRRKMLRASLRSLDRAPEALLAAAGLPPNARAEQIDVAGFCRLARAHAARGDRAS